MNDQKIYELIAKHGRVRAVQLADWLDKELVDVSKALRTLVDIGDVNQFKALAPNGCEALHYELSNEFKASRAGREILARVAMVAPAASAPVANPAPAPAAEAEPLSALAVESVAAAQGTKTDRAVALVNEQGLVSDDQMRVVFGIPRTSYPSAYLTCAIKAGKLHKTPEGWKPGRAPGGAEYKGLTSPAKGGPKAQFDPKAPLEYPAGTERPVAATVPSMGAHVVSQDEVKAVAAIDAWDEEQKAKIASLQAAAPKPVEVPVFAPLAPAAAAPSYRAALWSDGMLELQRNGLTVMECTRGEHEFMAEFLARALGQADKVAA